MGQVKGGTSVRQVAKQASVLDSYVARILPLALLPPRIQEAISDGSHPIELTLETLVRNRLPMDWSAQERLIGFE